MSLEASIQLNTAAIDRLIAALQSAHAAVSQTPVLDKKDRPKQACQTPKAEKLPADEFPADEFPADEFPVDEFPVDEFPVDEFPVLSGDRAGTSYYVLSDHDTVYKQSPGDPDCTVVGAVRVSGLDYLDARAHNAARLATAMAQAWSVAAPTSEVVDPVATAEPLAPEVVPAQPVFQDVVAKCQLLHRAKGNAGLAHVLSLFGAVKVPALANDASKFVAIIDAIDAMLVAA